MWINNIWVAWIWFIAVVLLLLAAVFFFSSICTFLRSLFSSPLISSILYFKFWVLMHVVKMLLSLQHCTVRSCNVLYCTVLYFVMLCFVVLLCPVHQFCWKRAFWYFRVASSLEDCHCVILYYILYPFPSTSFHFHCNISRSNYFCSRLRIDDFFFLIEAWEWCRFYFIFILFFIYRYSQYDIFFWLLSQLVFYFFDN